MAIKNLESLYDLVGGFGEAGGPVNNMENQTGKNFPIVGPGVTRGGYPFSTPVGSQLHAGPLENQAGRSLVGPAYTTIYGGAAFTANPSILDMDGVTPPLYKNVGPDEGFYGY